MKNNIEDYFQAIDASFKNKTQKDIYMIYLMIFGVILAFSYILFWDVAEVSFKEKNDQISQISSDIDADKAFLQANPESKITILDLEIKKLTADFEEYTENNSYIKRKVEGITTLIYDERIWGEYLHSISINAKKYNIKILDFTNVYASADKSFGHILDINLSTTAKYKNTLKFINSLEQSDLVIDIHKLEIKANKRLDTNISISVWGITY